ncbi:hypothetical protein C0J52_07567 [Blattella germanica]|nr:hypothetical protein C0J52_07567 [Blattella germanica]
MTPKSRFRIPAEDSKWVRCCGTLPDGHWVRVSVSVEAAMSVPARIASLLLVCGVSALPANRTGKVLNFFPIPVSVDCVSSDGRRTGTCLNTYECRMQGGRSHGPCALGFGVCCVFTATCGMEVQNNVTYFVNPSFPTLSREADNCKVKIQKVDPSISQLRLDFIHFNMGQPNRRTGVCDADAFIMSGGNAQDIKLCGQNSGQHGIIQTMNFAINGRHLADQDYNICMRQEEGMCSIAYEPCDENSFRIGPSMLVREMDQEEAVENVMIRL